MLPATRRARLQGMALHRMFWRGGGYRSRVRARARDAALDRAMQCRGWLNFHATLSGESAGIKFDSNRYGRIDFTITPIGVTHVTTTNYLFS